MTKEERHQLILDCRVYDGSNHPEIPFYYEECWVRFHEDEEHRKYLQEETEYYRREVGEDFSKDDGTPISLKAILFNRHEHWCGGYNLDRNYTSFKDWYTSQYRDVAPTHRQARYRSRREKLLKLCRFYNDESECPYSDCKSSHFWKYEQIWVNDLAHSYSNAEKFREDLHRFPEIEKFVLGHHLPTSLIGLLVNREEHWMGIVVESDFIKGLKKDYLKQK